MGVILWRKGGVLMVNKIKKICFCLLAVVGWNQFWSGTDYFNTECEYLCLSEKRKDDYDNNIQ